MGLVKTNSAIGGGVAFPEFASLGKIDIPSAIIFPKSTQAQTGKAWKDSRYG